ncbi:uncharacterized protein V6R79_014296 [Siganus canaliculatus]
MICLNIDPGPNPAAGLKSTAFIDEDFIYQTERDDIETDGKPTQILSHPVSELPALLNGTSTPKHKAAAAERHAGFTAQNCKMDRDELILIHLNDSAASKRTETKSRHQ